MKSLIDIINEKLILSKIKYKDPKEEYFYHEALEDGYMTMFVDTENILQYSIDNCQTWNDLEVDTKTTEINQGERIYFKGENMNVDKDNGIGIFQTNKKFNVGGNIMSLIYGDDFKEQTKLEGEQFEFLFYYNEYLISAENLILPATKLTKECYYCMFYKCTSLIDAPKLPANKLAYGCYLSMFSGCTSLVNAPELSATKLAESCYSDMFNGCKSLVNAPELPATKLEAACYQGMFAYCTSLNKITMLATDISAVLCLSNWVCDVSSSGTFIKTKDVNIYIPEGRGGIPKGWTIKET